MRISDWSSDVCSSDLPQDQRPAMPEQADRFRQPDEEGGADDRPEEVARTADQRHEDDVAGAQPIDRVDRNDAVDQPVERPGQAGERAGDNEAGDRKSTRLNSSN